MQNRIKYIRKTVLNMSRVKFGQQLGMTEAEIKNLEYGLVKIKDIKLQLLCSTYGINEHWLRTGEGEPFDADRKPFTEDEAAEAFRFLGKMLDELRPEEAVMLHRMITKKEKG